MKKHAAIAACFYVAGCSFHPLYGGRLEPQMASVYVEPIEERDGYELRTRLIDLLHTDGRQEGKRYFLKVILNESAQGIALQNDATITRYNNTLDAKYVLSDAQGTTLFTGTQTELASYNVVNSPYATLTAAQDSSKRAAQQMAERIQLDLGVWFRKRGK